MEAANKYETLAGLYYNSGWALNQEKMVSLTHKISAN